MKTITTSVLTALSVSLPLLFSSCVIVEDTTSGATETETSTSTAPGYKLGYEKGMSDGSGGLSRTPSRYGYLYSEADRADFLSGYEAGYNAGIR